MMKRFVDMDKVSLSLDDGRTVDVTQGIDKLHAIVKAQKTEPGVKQTMDCPICGAKASMTYVLSPYNGHLHAGCSRCQVTIMQ